jgi:hypothetical protein
MLATAIASPPPPPVEPLRLVVGGRDGLASALERFARRTDARVCASSHGAYANDLAMSARFVRALRDERIAARLLLLEARQAAAPAAQGRWAHTRPGDVTHVVAAVREMAVDWTARQLDPAAPFPLVCRVGDLLEHWSRVRRWSCERCGRVVEDLAHLSLAAPGLAELHRFAAVKTAGAGPYTDRRFLAGPPARPRCRPGCER